MSRTPVTKDKDLQVEPLNSTTPQELLAQEPASPSEPNQLVGDVIAPPQRRMPVAPGLRGNMPDFTNRSTQIAPEWIVTKTSASGFYFDPLTKQRSRVLVGRRVSEGQYNIDDMRKSGIELRPVEPGDG